MSKKKATTKKTTKKAKPKKKTETDFVALLESKKISDIREDINIVLEGQYKTAYDAMLDAHAAGLYVGLVGPVGCGKTALCRKFAYDLGREFYWVTFSDLVRPATLIGSFDPTLVFKYGFSSESYVPGPFTLAGLQGGIFLANEINRGDEYVLNSMLDAMEEGRLYIPQLRSWVNVDEDFYVISAMNPSELRGTRKLPEAIRDRIKVWIHLGYPPRALERKIVESNCPEYKIPPIAYEKILELLEQFRGHQAVDSPPSLRSSIGIARLAAERAKRYGTEIDNKIIAEAANLILPDSCQFKPGRDAHREVKKIVQSTLGVS
jgi:MoxR-like ATPase